MYKIIISSIIISSLYFLYNKKNTDISKIQEFDIIIGPGGYYGFYILGICHYIKNTYDLSNTKMIGFSAGSIAVFFMSLPDRLTNIYINELFTHKITPDLSVLANNLFTQIKKKILFKDLSLSNKYIGLTTSSYTLDIKNTFISTNDLVNCMQASSFVPMITRKSLLYYYNGNAYFDGALSYWRLRKSCKKKCLIISYNMFGRYNHLLSGGLTYNPNMSIYDMYIKGYRDAISNKKYLDTFLI